MRNYEITLIRQIINSQIIYVNNQYVRYSIFNELQRIIECNFCLAWATSIAIFLQGGNIKSSVQSSILLLFLFRLFLFETFLSSTTDIFSFSGSFVLPRFRIRSYEVLSYYLRTSRHRINIRCKNHVKYILINLNSVYIRMCLYIEKMMFRFSEEWSPAMGKYILSSTTALTSSVAAEERYEQQEDA